MMLFESKKLSGWRIVFLCIGLSLFLGNCATTPQEAIDLKPHVNKAVLRVNELANQVYDLESRLKALEKRQTEVPDHVRRLANLENRLESLEEEVHTRFTAEQENENLWKNFDQKFQGLRWELENERKNLQEFRDEISKKIEALSLTGKALSGGESQSFPLQESPQFNTEKEKTGKEEIVNNVDKQEVSPDNSLAKRTDKDAYEDAYQSFTNGDFSEARKKFESFLPNYPASTFADNAQYWIGECFYNQKEYERAILEYEKVIQNYSKGDKVISALYKQGFAFHALGRSREAKILFEQVIRKDPQSEQAQIAKKKLEALKKEEGNSR